MRILLVILVLIAIPAVIAMVASARKGRRHQAEPIDADREQPPPGPVTTEHMADPPPGSQADREHHGKP